MYQQVTGYTAYSTFIENLETETEVKTKRSRNGRMKYFFQTAVVMKIPQI